MKQVLAWMLAMTLVSSVGAGTTVAAQQTWIGEISDSQCGADHGTEIDERHCTQRCIQIGHEYVLFTDGKKLLKIANQNFAALPQYAGREVRLTGEQKGNAILVSKIEMRPRPKSK